MFFKSNRIFQHLGVQIVFMLRFSVILKTEPYNSKSVTDILYLFPSISTGGFIEKRSIDFIIRTLWSPVFLFLVLVSFAIYLLICHFRKQYGKRRFSQKRQNLLNSFFCYF